MNLVQEIRTFLKVRVFAHDALKEGTRMYGTKPGYKTTEFWLTILTNLGTLVSALDGAIPPDLCVKIVTAINATYAVARAVTKGIADVQSVRTPGSVLPPSI